MNTTRTTQPTLYGNLGGDPRPIKLPGRTREVEIYDPITDGTETRTYTTEPKEFLVASLAVNARTQDGETITRWIPLVDHHAELALCRKGDRLSVTGFFRNRSYIDKRTGEERTVRELVVTSAKKRHAS